MNNKRKKCYSLHLTHYAIDTICMVSKYKAPNSNQFLSNSAHLPPNNHLIVYNFFKLKFIKELLMLSYMLVVVKEAPKIYHTLNQNGIKFLSECIRTPHRHIIFRHL
jgi:hypothetical protein